MKFLEFPGDTAWMSLRDIYLYKGIPCVGLVKAKRGRSVTCIEVRKRAARGCMCDDMHAT